MTCNTILLDRSVGFGRGGRNEEVLEMIGLEIRDTKEDDDLMVATVSTNLDLDDNAMIQKNITTFDRFSSTY